MTEMLMYKVTYQNKGSEIIHTALFTCNMEANWFADGLKKLDECDFVSLNQWSWKVQIED